MKKKIFYLFAGINGAGKTTLYNTSIFNNKNLGTRINTDEIVRKIGDWRLYKDQIAASRIAIKMRNTCIENGETFNQESTLTGKNILKTINEVKEKGYEIHLFYVGVESYNIAKERIKARVSHGGHDISPQIVEKRYTESINNLSKIIEKCIDVVVYDNTNSFKECIRKQDNMIQISLIQPKWTKKIIEELEMSNRKKTIEIKNILIGKN